MARTAPRGRPWIDTLGILWGGGTPTDQWCPSGHRQGALRVIAIYIVTKNMTAEQHTKGRNLLREKGAPESAMKLHSCFGEDGQLQVFDVWESQEAFDEFLTYLGPVM